MQRITGILNIKENFCKAMGTIVIIIMLILSTVKFEEVSVKRIAIILGITLVDIMIIWSKNPFSKQINEKIGCVLFFLSPVFIFYIVERFNGVMIWNIEKIRFILNIVIILMSLLFIYIFINSIKWSVVISTIFFYIIASVNYFVVSFRSIPILATDIFSLNTALHVADNYSFDLDNIILSNAILVVTFTIIVCKINIKKRIRLKARVGGALVYCVLMLGFYNVFYHTNFIKNIELYVSSWNAQQSYAYNGSLLSFIVSSTYIKVKKPNEYSLENVDKIIDFYKQYENEEIVYKTPNVIVIMNESFCDLRVLGDFETSEDYMPFIRSISENTVSGNLFISVFGGNTPNSEFEFLTGNTTAFLPAFSVPYQLYINNYLPSITYNMKAQGYIGNKAIHPYDGGTWSRTTIYPLLGFEDYIYNTAFDNPQYIREFISDKSSFQKIIEEYENAREADATSSFYAFNVTMQNHGGYDEDYDNLNDNIKILGSKHNKQAERYLNLIKKTDEAFEELVNYFSKVDEDTVILLFGDHQPSLPEEFYQSIEGNTSDTSKIDILSKYKVPFVIWANYDIGAEKYERLSANYLSSVLLETIGAKKTGYNKFLLDLCERVPVITANGYYGENGKFYLLTDKSIYSDILNQYSILQYNNMVDILNRRDDFFSLIAYTDGE